MTENKRFTINEYSDVNKIDDNLKGEFYIIANAFDTSQLCDLLNKLWEQTNRFAQHNKELEEENEQLKEDKERIVKKLNKKATELYVENKQLKKQNENLQNLIDALERQLKICEYGDFKYE